MEAATQAKHDSVRVLIVDDEPLFVEMVEALLATDARIAVAGRAKNGLEAVDLQATLAPDVTLMDISMPLVDGIEATRRIRERRPTACILMLTGSIIAAEIDRSRQAGASGYLTKDRVGPQLVEAIIDLSRR